MFQTADKFFTSLGQDPLFDKVYEKSILSNLEEYSFRKKKSIYFHVFLLKGYTVERIFHFAWTWTSSRSVLWEIHAHKPKLAFLTDHYFHFRFVYFQGLHSREDVPNRGWLLYFSWSGSSSGSVLRKVDAGETGRWAGCSVPCVGVEYGQWRRFQVFCFFSFLFKVKRWFVTCLILLFVKYGFKYHKI